MRRTVPTIKPSKKLEVEMANWRGMNNTTHPTLLPLNIPSNLQNSYFQDGVLEKRNGFTRLGSNTTAGVHLEEFTTTTKKDATNTTGEWTTDGTANLFSNTTNEIYAGSFVSNGNPRMTVVSSNGTVIVIYSNGGVIVGQRSTDYGSTWKNLSGSSGTTTIEENGAGDWSICIDSSDNIHLVYTGLIDYNTYYRKLTYSAGDWSVGNSVTVNTHDMETDFTRGSIAVQTNGKLWISYLRYTAPQYVDVCIKSSSNGSTWSAETQLDSSYGSGYSHQLIINNDLPMIIYWSNVTHLGTLYSREYNGSSWDSPILITSLGDDTAQYFSVANVSNDNIYIAFASIPYSIFCYKFNGTTWSNIGELDTAGTSYQRYVSLTTDGTNLWAIWTKYEAATQYEINYKIWNGTSWSSVVAITSDNGNNTTIVSPEKITTILPMFWRTGTNPTFSMKSKVVQLSGVIQSIGYDSTSGSQSYTAQNISTLNGGTITYQYADSADNNTFSSWSSSINTLTAQYIKFKATISTTDLTVSPSLDSVTIVYSGLSVISMHSWTKPGTTEKYLLMVGGTSLHMYETTGGTFQSIKSNLTTGLRTTAVGFSEGVKSYFVITNGTDSVMRFNGKVSYGGVTCAGATKTVTSSGVACTMVDSGNKVTCTAHGYSKGQVVSFGSNTGGVTAHTDYYIIAVPDANTFQFATTADGSAFDVNANGANTLEPHWKTVGHMEELSVDSVIKIGSTWYKIESVTNNYTLVLVSNGPAVTGSAYDAYAINTLGGLSTAGIGGGELKGKYITTYKNQLMISGITGYESWVQVSAYMSGTTWSYSVDGSGNPTFTNGSGAINISTNDGQIVTALVPFGNSVQVHKSDIYGTRKSVFSLTRNIETWTNYQVTSQYAAVSQYATVTTPNAVFFVDRSGIVTTNGVTFNKLDNDISATTSLFNQTYIQNAVAAFNVQEGNEFVYFAVPISSSVTNNYLLMFDLQNKGWGIQTGLNMGCFAIYSNVYTPELYFGDQLANSQVLKWNSGTSDNGQPIEWIVETGEIQLKQYFERKKFKYLYAFFEPTGAYTIHAYYSVDGADYIELTDTMTLDSGPDDTFKRWTLPGLKGSSVKFKFYNNEKDQPITLVRAGVVIVEKGLRRV